MSDYRSAIGIVAVPDGTYALIDLERANPYGIILRTGTLADILAQLQSWAEAVTRYREGN